MSSSTFNIGVLGAGQIAQAAHFSAVRKAKTAQLYAICDAADDLRERMAAVHQPTTTFADYDAMLADDPDLWLVNADMRAWTEAHPCECEALCTCDRAA